MSAVFEGKEWRPLLLDMDSDKFAEKIAHLDCGNPGAINLLCQLPAEYIAIVERSELRGAAIYDRFKKEGSLVAFVEWLAFEGLSQALGGIHA